MLELSGKNFKEAIIKLLQWAIKSTLKQVFKNTQQRNRKSLQRSGKYKKNKMEILEQKQI